MRILGIESSCDETGIAMISISRDLFRWGHCDATKVKDEIV